MTNLVQQPAIQMTFLVATVADSVGDLVVAVVALVALKISLIFSRPLVEEADKPHKWTSLAKILL